MNGDTLDQLDRQLVHALQIDGRASFNRIARVLGVSDQTVARRYRRLRALGIARVIGATSSSRVEVTSWSLRLRCRPDAAQGVAVALARRPDTAWVALTSGGTEVTCVVRSTSPEQTDALILHTLPRTPRVVEVSAHCLIHVFLGGGEPWVGNLGALDPEQVAALMPAADVRITKAGWRPAGAVLTPDEPASRPDGDHPAQDDRFTEGDRRLEAALALDGRAGLPELASATGWSETRVRRRLDELRRTGAIRIEVEMDDRAAGYHAPAMLWASVAPHRLAQVGEALAEHAETAFVAATTGSTNLVASVVCRDVRELYRYLTVRVGGLRAMREVETTPVLRLIKREGALRPA